MRDYVLVQGMILETTAVNNYDRRLVILTKERGKITAFAKGARLVNSRMMAATNPFVFGTFKLYEGKNAYNVNDIEVSNYFEELRTDYEGAFLGMYFLELASYYTRENNDESEMLKLLYQSVRAIIKDNIDNRLVRAVYEIKTLVINGEFPGIVSNRSILPATEYAIGFIQSSSVSKLYTFSVSEKVLNELSNLANEYRIRCVDHRFKSLETLDFL